MAKKITTSTTNAAVVEELKAETRSIKVPFGDVPMGYFSERVDIRLTNTQRESLSRAVSGLDRLGARLADGRRVTTGVDAIRWMLERIASEAPEAPDAPEAPEQSDAN
jgi:hypothetical protein